jgi:peroxiredoxin
MRRLLAVLLLVMVSAASWALEPLSIPLTDMDGKPTSLQEHTGKGKWLVVMIWAHDCHVCNQEAPNYDKFHTAHKDKDATVLGLSLDGKDLRKEALAFTQRHKLGFPSLIGEPHDVGAIYNGLTGGDFAGTPTFLIFDPKGVIRAEQAGAVPVDLIEQFIRQNG